MAQRQRRSGRTGTAQRAQGQRARQRRDLACSGQGGPRGGEPRAARADERTKFQVTALLAAEERARVRADASVTDAQRDVQLRRLDGIATILAQIAVREPLALLGEDAEVSDSARRLKREMQVAGMG